jgi:hypothetical protein
MPSFEVKHATLSFCFLDITLLSHTFVGMNRVVA